MKAEKLSDVTATLAEEEEKAKHRLELGGLALSEDFARRSSTPWTPGSGPPLRAPRQESLS